MGRKAPGVDARGAGGGSVAGEAALVAVDGLEFAERLVDPGFLKAVALLSPPGGFRGGAGAMNVGRLARMPRPKGRAGLAVRVASNKMVIGGPFSRLSRGAGVLSALAAPFSFQSGTSPGRQLEYTPGAT